jgi:hypothetical protein
MCIEKRTPLVSAANPLRLGVLSVVLALIPAAHAQQQVWITQFGSSADDNALAPTPDGAGGAMMAGDTLASLGGPSAGKRDAFLARCIDAPCDADCDQSTGSGILDIFDFLCFQNAFVAGCP